MSVKDAREVETEDWEGRGAVVGVEVCEERSDQGLWVGTCVVGDLILV